MTPTEIANLLIKYYRRHPNVTVCELFSDIDVFGKDRLYTISTLQIKNYSVTIDFEKVTGSTVIHISENCISVFDQNCNLVKSNLAIMKLLTDGREDLI